jgi:hypothetical protein
MTDAELVWNRAEMEQGGDAPGDRALAALLWAHRLTMNGGVLYAVEVLPPSDLAEAAHGYGYFSFTDVADLLLLARWMVDHEKDWNVDIESHKHSLDAEYTSQIPDVSALFERFEERFKACPDEFAPLQRKSADIPLSADNVPRHWFNEYCHRLDRQPPDLPLRCPCCGCKTLGERGGFEICQVCYWEDDGQDDYDADSVRGGPNGSLSLSEARSNYLRFGACEERMMGNVRAPRPEELP